MAEKLTIERAKAAKREGKSPTTQAGEFVHEEIHHVRAGKHGARSTKQAIAIGLSKARRAGVKLAPPKRGTASEAVRRRAPADLAKGRRGAAPSCRRSDRARGPRGAPAGRSFRRLAGGAGQTGPFQRSPPNWQPAPLGLRPKRGRTKGPAGRAAAAGERRVRTRASQAR
jgi:hypothetical protein